MQLKDIERFAGIVARERTRGRSDYDDAKQEGMISAWQVLSKRPDAPKEYIIAAVKNGVNCYVGRGHVTGRNQQGKKDTWSVTDYIPETMDFESSDVSDIENRQIMVDALNTLEPHDKLFAYYRFYEGLTGAEAAKIIGMPKGTLERRWVEIARPKLRRILENSNLD